MPVQRLKMITVLSVLLAMILAVVSYFGAFVPGTYDRDAASMAAQGAGQDMVDLFLVTPLLLILLVFVRKNNRITSMIFSGIVFYILYSFVIYCFGVHFNRLFLLYCAILGISFYLFIMTISYLNQENIKNWFNGKVSARMIGIFFIIIAVMFYMLWLKDVVPAVLNNTIPASVSDYHLLVNPVHVLDISIVLPGLFITAILIMKKQPLGYILTPVFLVFIILMAIALIAMVLMVKAQGYGDETSVAGIFMVIAGISILLLTLFLKSVK